MKSFIFTKEDIKRLEKPLDEIKYYKDKQEKRLKLYITSNGSVTFFVRQIIREIR